MTPSDRPPAAVTLITEDAAVVRRRWTVRVLAAIFALSALWIVYARGEGTADALRQSTQVAEGQDRTIARLERRVDELEAAQVCRSGVSDAGFVALAGAVGAIGNVVVELAKPPDDPTRAVADAVAKLTTPSTALVAEAENRPEATAECAASPSDDSPGA